MRRQQAYDSKTRRGFLSVMALALANGARAADMSMHQQLFMLCVRKKAPAPALPYDYEVEYIERDYAIAWSTSIYNDGFNLTQYIYGDSLATFSRTIELVWSFSAVTSGVMRGLYFGTNAFTHVALWKPNGYDTYKFGIPSSGQTSVSGDLGTFHKQSIVPDGSGHYDCYMDNTFFTTVTQTSTAVMTLMYLFTRNNNSEGTGKVRVSSFKVGSDVDLIPVVKGNSVGFYNKVDGELFLEEQACLGAGPRV